MNHWNHVREVFIFDEKGATILAMVAPFYCADLRVNKAWPTLSDYC